MFWVHEKEIHPGPAFGCENQKRKGKTKMKSKKAVRSALGMSVLSIALCAAMLIGTTFAWFTDTATTSVNKIQSGTLDIALEMKDNEGKWVSAEGKTLNFLRKNGETLAEDANILWEPGCTYQLPQLRVRNNGNLALKYKVAITGIQGDTGLVKVIEWTVKNGEADYDLNAEHHLAAKTTADAPADVFTISAHMQETAGNEYQNKSIENIAITVVATQDTVEYDSKDNQYDALAEYPVYAAAPVVKDEEGKAAADVKLASSAMHTETSLPLATATVPAGTAVADDATQLELIIEKAATPSNFTVAATQNEPKTLDITLKGLDENNDKPIKVEFYIEKSLSLVEIDHNGRKMSRCSAMKWLDADQEFYYDSATGLVTMLTKTFSPFTYTSDKFYWDNQRADAYETPVDTENKVITVASAEELALFKYEITDAKVNYSGYTLNITNDIDLGSGFWRPIDPINNMTINGNGHTISNLLVRSCTNSSGYGFGFISNATGTVTIRDLIFDNANVAMAKGYEKYYSGNVGGVVLAYAYGTTEFDNVQVINSFIAGYGKIGMLLGMGADPGVKVTFKDCVSQNNTINAAYDMGGLAGMIQRGDGVDNGSVENCTVENITVNYDPASTYVDVKGTATFKSNDQPSGTDVTREIDGKYLDESGYYWCGYGDYYVSYGNSSYDAPVEGYSKALANSEYPVNK